MRIYSKNLERQKTVEKDGFHIDAIVPVFASTDSDDGRTMLKAFGNIIIKLTDIFISSTGYNILRI